MQTAAFVILCAILYVHAQEIVNFVQQRLNGKEATIYRHKFLTSNDIRREEAVHVPQGHHPKIIIRGCYSYPSPEGYRIAVEYIGDKDGYRLPLGFKFGSSVLNQINPEACQAKVDETHTKHPNQTEAPKLPSSLPAAGKAEPMPIPSYVLKSMVGEMPRHPDQIYQPPYGGGAGAGKPIPPYVLKSMVGEMQGPNSSSYKIKVTVYKDDKVIQELNEEY